MKLNSKVIALHMIVLGTWVCFLAGFLLAMMSNGHNRFNSNPLSHHVKYLSVAINSRETKIFEDESEEKGVKKKRLYSKMYTRVSLKADEDAFVRLKRVAAKLDGLSWWRKIIFR